ncbi:unnamed protein product [Diabrotica balteata]|uniref:Uncharacterized protein n=1 Tax=Diabrotica balteata TaxID=107213 RepID=A0A9N9T8F5_DIABA|nr:unnamed protein product [Diabrotica balteata]
MDDYKDALKSKLLNTQPKKLKEDGIPSLFLLPNENGIQEISFIESLLKKTKHLIIKKNTPIGVTDNSNENFIRNADYTHWYIPRTLGNAEENKKQIMGPVQRRQNKSLLLRTNGLDYLNRKNEKDFNIRARELALEEKKN